jgi:hypothetical protein
MHSASCVRGKARKLESKSKIRRHRLRHVPLMEYFNGRGNLRSGRHRRLLPESKARPRYRCTADKCDELAPSYAERAPEAQNRGIVPLEEVECPLWVKSRHLRRNEDVRFTPDNDRESGFPHKVMSALPPKSGHVLALVCFGPIADIRSNRVFSFKPRSAP